MNFLTIERRLALVIALIALLELWFTLQVPEPSTFMVVGPRLFPYVLGGGLLLSALLLFLLPVPKAGQTAGEQQVAEHTEAAGLEGVASEDEESPLEWRRVLLIIGITMIYVLVFQPLGFVLTTAPFIAVAARVLGSRHWIRDGIVAIAVTLGIYYLFTQLLKVTLPGFPFTFF